MEDSLWQHASGLQTRPSLVHCYDWWPQSKLWSTQICRRHHLDKTDNSLIFDF